MEVWKFFIVNLYNSYNNLEEKHFQEVMDKISAPVVWVGDFNAHNELWGGQKNDRNGIMIGEFMDKNNLVVLNDGRLTWFREIQSLSSAIDITMVSAELAAVSGWEVDQYAMGSDYIPIVSNGV